MAGTGAGVRISGRRHNAGDGGGVSLTIKCAARPQSDLFDAATTPYAYRVVASNWPAEEKTEHEVLCWHNQRGQAENFHKELKHGLGMDPMPCGDAGANAVFFRIGVLAYNLFIGFKRLACPAVWEVQTIATVRGRLVQVARRILRHAGRVVLRLGLEAEALACWHTIRQRCWRWVS
ncbi:MAG: transposase [Nitrospiraceae bacterium]